MFLNRLKKKEKVAFLELAHHIARSDNDFSESQQDIIQTYCIEMQIEDIKYSKKKFDLEKTLSNFKKYETRKIVLIETMALIYSDSILHKEEKKILNVMLKNFNISQSLAVTYAEWTKAIMALYTQGESLIDL